MSLTPEEEAEFTVFNCQAYELYRMQCIGVMIPYRWLCMSQEAKDQAREKFATWLTQAMQSNVPFTVERAVEIINEKADNKMREAVESWKNSELHYKCIAKEENNSRPYYGWAFFAP